MDIDKNELLEKAKELLKEEVTSISFETWIKPLKIKSIDSNHIVFIANSEYQKDSIETRYSSLIFNTIKYITNRDYTFSVILEDSNIQDNELVISENQNLNENESYDYSNTNLNPKYTFETFVVGNNNRFAHAAALAVGDSPSNSYNPLFL